MDKKKLTEEELYKHVDALMEELESSDTQEEVEKATSPEEEDVEVKKSEEEVEVEIEAKTDTDTEEVEKAYKKADKKKDDEDEDEDEEKEQPEQFQKKKKAIKKSVEVDEGEYNELLAKAEKLEDLTKTEEVPEEDKLQKALDELSTLKDSIENLKKAPGEKKSVDGLEVIEKGNPEGEEKKAPKDLLKSLTRSKVADIMVDDLIIKGVEGVRTQDVCEYEANGFISNEVAREKTLEAVNKRFNEGSL